VHSLDSNGTQKGARSSGQTWPPYPPASRRLARLSNFFLPDRFKSPITTVTLSRLRSSR
ncbi:hypothetical protein BaRGS_00005757, partial [Batillaria attramentaria]